MTDTKRQRANNFFCGGQKIKRQLDVILKANYELFELIEERKEEVANIAAEKDPEAGGESMELQDHDNDIDKELDDFQQTLIRANLEAHGILGSFKKRSVLLRRIRQRQESYKANAKATRLVRRHGAKSKSKAAKAKAL